MLDYINNNDSLYNVCFENGIKKQKKNYMNLKKKPSTNKLL